MGQNNLEKDVIMCIYLSMRVINDKGNINQSMLLECSLNLAEETGCLGKVSFLYIKIH